MGGRELIIPVHQSLLFGTGGAVRGTVSGDGDESEEAVTTARW